MKNSILYSHANDGIVICNTCSHYCNIAKNAVGKCGLRVNIDGTLKVLNSGKIIHIAIDPIEKKPLFHFFPGSKILSISGLGCNFRCPFCINWDTAQFPNIFVKEHNREETNNLIKDSGYNLLPHEIIDQCKAYELESIAYTYNEPTVMLETYLPIMKLARKNNIKNVWVSNGYFSVQSFKLFSPYLDAINIDLKSYSDKFYKRHCEANLEVVKNNIKLCYEKNIWIEVTTLLIPNENDSEAEIKKIAAFIKNISPNIPLHFSAFTPEYRMLDKPITPNETLNIAKQIAEKTGLNYVYLGNNHTHSHTYCPKCSTKIIERDYMSGFLQEEKIKIKEITENNDKQKRLIAQYRSVNCKKCGFDIAGRF